MLIMPVVQIKLIGVDSLKLCTVQIASEPPMFPNENLFKLYSFSSYSRSLCEAYTNMRGTDSSMSIDIMHMSYSMTLK